MFSLARFLSKHSQEEEVAGQEMPERHGSRSMFFVCPPSLGIMIICALAFVQKEKKKKVDTSIFRPQ